MHVSFHFRILAALALALVALPLLPAVPASHGAGVTIPCTDMLAGQVVCPDLLVDPARMSNAFTENRNFASNSCAVVEGMTTPGQHRLLRWTFTTPNMGLGDLIVGRPANHPEWFDYSACHRHYHFKEYADYRLWTPGDFAAYEQLRLQNPGVKAAEILAANPDLAPVSDHKYGFCVIDIQPYGGPSQNYRSCGSNQGISVGWADEYHSSLDGQWIDITGLPAGAYILENEVNSEWLYEESSYDNNRAYFAVRI